MATHLNKNADVVLLQETHFLQGSANKYEAEWGNKMYHSFGTNLSSGVTISIGKNIDHEVLDEIRDDAGRMLILIVRIEHLKACIVNCYAPNGDCPEFFIDLIGKVESAAESDLTIIGGDFNLVLDPEMDRLNSKHNPPKACDVLVKYLNKAHLIDSWRMLHPDTKEFTWSRTSCQNPSASRIDMIFLPVSWSNKIIESNISPCRRTDHKLISTTLSIDEIARGPGIWKFNNTLLLDHEFVTETNWLIDRQYPLSEFLNPSDMWLHLKKVLTETAKEYSKNKAKIKNYRKINLEKLLDLLNKEFNKGCSDAALIDEINKINKELDEIAHQETLATIFRSKAKWVKEGERNSKYFFSLEKKKYMSKNMASLLK